MIDAPIIGPMSQISTWNLTHFDTAAPIFTVVLSNHSLIANNYAAPGPNILCSLVPDLRVHHRHHDLDVTRREVDVERREDAVLEREQALSALQKSVKNQFLLVMSVHAEAERRWVHVLAQVLVLGAVLCHKSAVDALALAQKRHAA